MLALKNSLLKYSQRPMRALSLRILADIKPHELSPALFLHAELPTRLLSTLQLITSSKIPIKNQPSFQLLAKRFMEDVQTLLETPLPDSLESEKLFKSILKNMREKQKENQEILKSGVQEFQKHWKNLSLEPSTELQNFMDKFLTISLSQNLLISEYLALNDDKNGNKNLVRTINPKTVADNAVINASEVIKKKYGVPPPIVEIVSLNESLTTLYVESHLQRMLYEIIKTSMISTVEHHWDDFHNTKPSNSETTQKNSKDDTQKENTSSWTKFFHSSLSPPNETQLTKNSNNKKKEFPPIKLVICEGKEDVTFMIKDKGGGIPDKSIKSLWLYESNQKFSGKKVSEIVTANGFPPINRQYSLPFSRVMARYFGGDLEVVSMEGRGTQIYLSLFKNETQLENLPDLTAHQEIILGEKKVKSSNLEEIPNVYANQSTAITSNSTATNFAKLNNPPWVLSLSWPGLKKISTAGSAV